MRPASLGVLCFRRRFGGEADGEIERLNARLVAALGAEVDGFVSSTRLRGRFAIRLCVFNHTSAERDVRHAIEWLERAEVEAEPEAAGGRHEPESDPHQPLVRAGEPGENPREEELHSLPLLEGFDTEQLAVLAGASRVASAEAGERLTERWGGGRDFYVLLKGSVRVELDGAVIRELGPGEFFGELAALDWGAGYGYTRLATVIAAEPARLLVVPPDVFNRMTAEVPPFGERISGAVRERLPLS